MLNSPFISSVSLELTFFRKDLQGWRFLEAADTLILQRKTRPRDRMPDSARFTSGTCFRQAVLTFPDRLRLTE